MLDQVSEAKGKRRIDKYFNDYSSHHRTRGNKILHYFGIPMIAVSLLGLLGTLVFGPHGVTGSPFLRLDAGTALIGLTLLWYLTLDWRLALPFGLMALGLYFL